MSVEIKNVDSGNVAEIAALAKIIWNEHFTPIIGKAQVDYMLEKFQSEQAMKQQLKDGMKYIAVYSNGELAGYSGYKLEDNALFLSKLYVKSEKRGLGLGKAMFTYELNTAKNECKEKIYLTVNKHNANTIAVYEHLGFVNAKSTVTDIGNGFVMDDYIMEYYI
ncbi:MULTISPECIES: GNAT family N-acetyltransferase [unclassified Ruminococcus]|uniref:GNAT family N-acetyltransferase n=1 Tax=unclassified Ruminococcus TaxID=2608920 RepID=UPI00210C732F|nr:MULTISPECIES: GNAT family N-acetyltransferase [unclassified Ruminococcus]MCQ4023369.1 GNAT family N-acetyltransferase [Ruminococcus sp. zg-924]MCQ4115736.1 GNAT family N-acetyltransferase [Ruminococcus sp. zg-921]